MAIETSVAAFRPADWNACFKDEVEDWAFYRACEAAGPPGFSWFYAAAYSPEGGLMAVIPGFTTDYALDTTLQGPLKAATEALRRVAPRLVTLRLMALGSPVAEVCHLGFSPEVPASRRQALAMQLVDHARADGARRGYRLFGIKDAPEKDAPIWAAITAERGFSRMPGLPTAYLDLPHTDLDAYLKSLSRASRKDMKRKMKAFADIVVERRTDMDGIEGEVERLYEATLARSDLQFERLSGAYFAAVLRSMAPHAMLVLFRAEGRLVAFNLLLEKDGVLVDKYIGMDYDVVQRYSLYFNTWITNVSYCLAKGIRVYQSGQALYEPKLRLGCKLKPNWHYFRHANVVVNAVLRLVARISRLDRFDPALAALTQEGRLS